MRRTVISMCLLSQMVWGQAPPSSAAPKPDWVERLPEGAGKVYALGMADLASSEGQALLRAGDRARLEVVSRLRASVKGQTTVATQNVTTQRAGEAKTGYGQTAFSETISITAQVEDLPGLAVEQTFVDPKGRTAYALASLDLALATRGMADKLASLKALRLRTEREATRKSLWRLRKAQSDLDLLDGQIAMLGPAGMDPAMGTRLGEERNLLRDRIAQLEAIALPSLDMSKMSLAIQCNLELPPNLSDWLDAQITAAGLRRRSAGADFILELTFQGGRQGPEFIFIEPQFWGATTYRIEAKAVLRDAGGVVLGRVVPISLARDETAQGLMQDFERVFRRRFNALVDQLRGELE